MPVGHRERDVSAADVFSGGRRGARAAALTSQVGQVKDTMYQLFGSVNQWVAQLTGFDLLEKLTPMALGDWGRSPRRCRVG